MIRMIPSLSTTSGKDFRKAAAVCCLMGAVLAGCAPAGGPSGTYDPNEAANRKIHAFNRSLDKSVIRPVAVSTTGKGLIAARISDASENLGKPADIVNNLLQLRLVKAGENTLRFTVNTIFGLGGLFDVASEAGLPMNDTDFGETLHIWGVAEGAYLEVPFIGPSTERDLVGTVVDVFIDPLNHLPKREALSATGIDVAAKIGDRGRYSDLVDSILYESADSYAQARLLYLQNRRHQLGQDGTESTFEDPYEDPYAE
jgi:phospholipid-binding lipoprotein MlaA